MFNWGGNTNFHSMNLDWLIQFAKDAQETINNALAAIQAAISQISGKQDLLVSGQNIKTINGESVLGSGNLEISGGSGDVSSVNGMTGDVVLDAYDLDYGDDTVGEVLNDIEDDVDELRQDVDDAVTDIGSIQTVLTGKQDALVSGQNIKTINGESVLGSGNLEISGGSGDVSSVNGMTGDVVLDAYDLDYGDDTVGGVLNDIEDDVDGLRHDVDDAVTDIGSIQTVLSGKQDALVSGQNIKTINGESVLGSGNLEISGGSGGSMIYSQTDSITLSNHNTVVITNPMNVYIEFPEIDTDAEFEARVAFSGSYSMSYDESVPVGFDLIWKNNETPYWEEYKAYLITYRFIGVVSSSEYPIIMASYEEVSF